VTARPATAASAPAVIDDDAAPLLIDDVDEAEAAVLVEAGELGSEAIGVELEVALPTLAARS
jgi:hypothetical protein